MNLFIKDFISDNSNYFSLESNQRVKSGYFGSKSKDLVEFVINLIRKN